MHDSRLWQVLCLLMLAGAGTACDEKLSDVTGPTQNLTPTFTSIQRDIFNAPDSAGRPACTQCHSPGGLAAGTGLILIEGAAYGNLVNRPSRLRPGETLVIPGDPSTSYLVRKLEGGPNINGVRMPFAGGPYLTGGQIAVIRRWIELGAANN